MALRDHILVSRIVSANTEKTCRFLSHVMLIEFVRGKLEVTHTAKGDFFLNGRMSMGMDVPYRGYRD